VHLKITPIVSVRAESTNNYTVRVRNNAGVDDRVMIVGQFLGTTLSNQRDQFL